MKFVLPLIFVVFMLGCAPVTELNATIDDTPAQEIILEEEIEESIVQEPELIIENETIEEEMVVEPEEVEEQQYEESDFTVTKIEGRATRYKGDLLIPLFDVYYKGDIEYDRVRIENSNQYFDQSTLYDNNTDCARQTTSKTTFGAIKKNGTQFFCLAPTQNLRGNVPVNIEIFIDNESVFTHEIKIGTTYKGNVELLYSS